ncbi:MAG TPA: TorF family putative porin [Limnobacter sp.]|nr:TorF family putative porin [Limnobacter sp.]
MKKLVLATAIAATTFGAVSTVQAGDLTITGNAGLFSDYRFRGISQTNNDVAFQGGFDLVHSSGFYAGVWNSNIGFGSGAPNGNGLETDVYGGYTFSIGPVAADVGLLQYVYSGTTDAATRNPAQRVKFDTLEAYAKASYAGFTLAGYYALSEDYFGTSDQEGPANSNVADMSGSTYVNLGYKYALSDKITLAAAVGQTNFEKPVAPVLVGTGFVDSYVDYMVGVTYNLNGFELGLAYVDGDDDMEAIAVGAGGFNRDAGKGDVVVSVKKSF